MSEPSLAGERLLLVEDDVTAASLLSRVLRRQGYLVDTAASVEEALELSARGPLQAAIVDLRLGTESGLRLVPALVSGHPGIRLLILTGYASIATAVQAIKLGATNYLAKPVNVAEILKALGEDPMDATREAPSERPSLRRFQWEYIQNVLAEHDGNVSRAAKALGLQRRTLQRKLAKRPIKT
jgi:two-component system response regulator RegA